MNEQEALVEIIARLLEVEELIRTQRQDFEAKHRAILQKKMMI